MTVNSGYSQPEQMLDPPALADMLRISIRHLDNVRRDDTSFPRPRMLGTLPRWSPEVIRRWMAEPPEEAPGAVRVVETPPGLEGADRANPKGRRRRVV
jgi:predicted DNA-binding transcriptional regulator AlpA